MYFRTAYLYQYPLQDMEKRTATRLSAMERNQAETNRRLDDMKSMLQSVLSNITGAQSGADLTVGKTGTQSVGETLGDKEGGDDREILRDCKSSSERWWDKQMEGSDDELAETEVQEMMIPQARGKKNLPASMSKRTRILRSQHRRRVPQTTIRLKSGMKYG
ncbi:hypothetical protein M758_UG239100 [Ceratodon purpureus]|nr:hypothetical protein M758_UG239100 [Ceratodon purpureus]